MFGFRKQIKAVIKPVVGGFEIRYPDGKIAAAVEMAQAEMKINRWFNAHGKFGQTEVRL